MLLALQKLITKTENILLKEHFTELMHKTECEIYTNQHLYIRKELCPNHQISKVTQTEQLVVHSILVDPDGGMPGASPPFGSCIKTK